MIEFEPKYITFDCYGTLVNFQMAERARELYSPRLNPEKMEEFVAAFRAYRLDEVLGAWKPFRDVIVNAVRRASKRTGIEFDLDIAEALYETVPTWGPHSDVPEGLSRLASKYKLVALSNASDDQIHHNVEKLGAPFYAVFTAQQAQSYKPRMQGFEYMLDKLGCAPGDVMHVSSSPRYDLMVAHDMGIKHKAFINRGHEPSTPFYEYHDVPTITALADLMGL